VDVDNSILFRAAAGVYKSSPMMLNGVFMGEGALGGALPHLLCLNTKMAHFEPKLKKILGRGTTPCPDRSPVGEV